MSALFLEPSWASGWTHQSACRLWWHWCRCPGIDGRDHHVKWLAGSLWLWILMGSTSLTLWFGKPMGKTQKTQVQMSTNGWFSTSHIAIVYDIPGLSSSDIPSGVIKHGNLDILSICRFDFPSYKPPSIIIVDWYLQMFFPLKPSFSSGISQLAPPAGPPKDSAFVRGSCNPRANYWWPPRHAVFSGRFVYIFLKYVFLFTCLLHVFLHGCFSFFLLMFLYMLLTATCDGWSSVSPVPSGELT